MKRIIVAVLICILIIPLCSVLKPVYATSGSSISKGVRNISVTWIVNTSNYKEALATVELEEGTFNFHVKETVLKNGFETYINLTLTDSEGTEIRTHVTIPDTLTDAPPSKSKTVEAWRLDIPRWAVAILRPILAAAVIALIVYLVVQTLIPLLSGDLLGFINGLGGFVWASIPWVLLTLFGDANNDGSVTLFFPYSPVDYVVSYLLNLQYVVATAINWWEISKKSWSWWFISFTWYEATWLYSRVPIVIPNIRPSASFEWSPEKPFALDTVAFFSTSFDPDGYITDYHWWFGDGVEAFARNVTHKYSRAGNYNVTLRVVDDDSQSAAASAIIPIMIPSAIDISPSALNLRSKGLWTTAYIEFPQGYSIRNINVSSILLNNTVSAEPRLVAVGDFDCDRIPDLMVKFCRADVTEYILDSVAVTGRFQTVTLTVAGRLYDGTLFQGNDAVRLIIVGLIS